MDEGPGAFKNLRGLGQCLDVSDKRTDEEGDEPIERLTRSEWSSFKWRGYYLTLLPHRQ